VRRVAPLSLNYAGGAQLNKFTIYELPGAVIGNAEKGADKDAAVGEDARMEAKNAHTDWAE
jgi:hypothetical protein